MVKSCRCFSQQAHVHLEPVLSSLEVINQIYSTVLPYNEVSSKSECFTAASQWDISDGGEKKEVKTFCFNIVKTFGSSVVSPIELASISCSEVSLI